MVSLADLSKTIGQKNGNVRLMVICVSLTAVLGIIGHFFPRFESVFILVFGLLCMLLNAGRCGISTGEIFDLLSVTSGIIASLGLFLLTLGGIFDSDASNMVKPGLWFYALILLLFGIDAVHSLFRSLSDSPVVDLKITTKTDHYQGLIVEHYIPKRMEGNEARGLYLTNTLMSLMWIGFLFLVGFDGWYFNMASIKHIVLNWFS